MRENVTGEDTMYAYTSNLYVYAYLSISADRCQCT